MKELDTWEAMQWAFEHYEKNTITVGEFNMWCDKYGEEHPDTYTHICRDDIAHEHACNRIWWEIRNDEPDLLHRQETIKCPICDTIVMKYPNVEYFEKIKQKIDKWNSK